MSEQPSGTPEQPSRYDRSFAGLIAAMIATVVFVAAYVGFRALTREQPDIKPEPIDYLQSVGELQQVGTTVVYPSALPDGWIATTIDYVPGQPPAWGINFLTDDGKFVGVRQEDTSVDNLLETYVDQHPSDDGDAAPENSLGAASWRTWSDSGGDHAYSTEEAAGPLAGDTLLVFGSAPVADQEELIALLSVEPVDNSPQP